MTRFSKLCNRFLRYIGENDEEPNWHAMAHYEDLSMYCAFMYVYIGMSPATILKILDAVKVGTIYAKKLSGKLYI